MHNASDRRDARDPVRERGGQAVATGPIRIPAPPGFSLSTADSVRRRGGGGRAIKRDGRGMTG